MTDNKEAASERLPQSPFEDGPYTPQLDAPIDVLIDLAYCNRGGTPETHGATPLDQLSTMHQQAELRSRLAFFTQHPPSDVPPNVAKFVEETFLDRFIARGIANDENYHSSLLNSRHYDDNPGVGKLIDKAEQGYASPAELLLVRQLLGIRSVELACLTHPYGRRLEALETMRETVRAGVLLMNGEVYEDPEEKFRIKSVILNEVSAADMPKVYSMTDQERIAIADEYGGVAGILMIRKRVLGAMPDGTLIKERSSFILRADADSMLTKADLTALADHEDHLHWDDTAAEQTGVQEIAAGLLKMDAPGYSLAIPVSSTIYAFNQETAAKVLRKQAQKVQTTPYSDTVIDDIRDLTSEGSVRSKRVRTLGHMLFVNSTGN